MDNDLIGIGDMARNSGLTVSALRFYDGAGVLVPASVDGHSGYRRYAGDQVLDARLIARLRRVGMPLADICRVLGRRSDLAAIDEILDAHLQRLIDGLSDARRELSAVRALLDLQETNMTATTCTVPARELAEALAAVRHAVSTDPNLPMFAGVLVDMTSDALTLVATDRYRMSAASVRASNTAGPGGSGIAPAEVVDAAIEALRSVDGPVLVSVSVDTVTLHTAKGRTVALDFPDHRSLMRTSGTRVARVQATAMRGMVEDATTWTHRRDQDGADYEVLTLGISDDGTLHVGRDDTESVSVNRDFILQAVDAAGGKELQLELNGPIAPLAIRSVGSSRSTIVMPTRID